ncbi:uncharacterized protein LOC132309315 [Cornus florida]|uniref:uncharacterized protein LOC132309315 n=1 Tax=Cornus florida TaxID=4283 RepID=UPI0028A17F74|nr:uncharacterized protein LOC132309315 [Cornus florida]
MALFRTIPDKVGRLWNEWNLRGAVLFSLFLQVLLIFLAPSRRRRKSRILRSVIWLAYLLADWVAVFAIGLISSNIGEGGNCDKLGVSKDLSAFWAPFLLLHLGGPDTITAFSLEDNELWLRHLLGLVIQLAAVVYVISRPIPNEFWIPTLLMLFAGAIKYAERTRALYLACSSNFKYNDHAPWRTFKEKDISSDLEVVKHGNTYFKLSKGLIIDGRPDPKMGYEIQQYFINRTCEDAFRVMEVELNCLYDILYTKIEVVHSKIGCIFSLLCSVLVAISFQQFVASHHTNRHKLIHGGGTDIVVTYTLLIGAVGLDFVSLLMLIFSDWTLVSELLEKNTITQQVRSIIFAIRKILIPILLMDKRWCQSVSQFNLISYCVAEKYSSWFNKVTGCFGLKEMRYIKTKPVGNELKEFIFTELKKKAVEHYETSKEIFSAKGNWTLKEYKTFLGDGYSSIAETVSEQVEYDESLLVWHIATELCYFKDGENGDDPNREYCKILSDYMLYLLAIQPTLVTNVAQVRFQETCRHAKMSIPLDMSDLRGHLLSKYGNLRGITRDRHSVLLGGRKLAKELLQLEDKKMMWEMMGIVWVELLCFGASHSKPSAHAQQLSNGGELITFIWLLMAHFAFVEGFPDNFRNERLQSVMIMRSEWITQKPDGIIIDEGKRPAGSFRRMMGQQHWKKHKGGSDAHKDRAPIQRQQNGVPQAGHGQGQGQHVQQGQGAPVPLPAPQVLRIQGQAYLALPALPQTQG